MSYSNRTPNPSEDNSRETTSTTRFLRRIEKPAAILIALLAWQAGAMLLSRPLLLVSPVEVFLTLFRLVVQQDFWFSVGFSFLRIGAGFMIALVAGILLAAVAARFRLVEVLLWPYMAFVKATPVASFIILCLIFLAASELSVFISFLMVLPLVYTNVLTGIRTTDKKLLEMAHVFHMRPSRRLLHLYMPAVKPFLLSAASLAAGLSWKAGIAAEVIGIPEGSIGERLYEAKVYISTPDLFAWTFVIIVISIAFEKSLVFLLRRLYQSGRGT